MNPILMYEVNRQNIQESLHRADTARRARLAQPEPKLNQRIRLMSWVGEQLILIGSQLKGRAEYDCADRKMAEAH